MHIHIHITHENKFLSPSHLLTDTYMYLHIIAPHSSYLLSPPCLSTESQLEQGILISCSPSYHFHLTFTKTKTNFSSPFYPIQMKQAIVYAAHPTMPCLPFPPNPSIQAYILNNDPPQNASRVFLPGMCTQFMQQAHSITPNEPRNIKKKAYQSPNNARSRRNAKCNKSPLYLKPISNHNELAPFVSFSS